MYPSEEMTREERASVSVEEFLKELIDVLNKKFEEQKKAIAEMNAKLDEARRDAHVLHREISDLQGNVNSINGTVAALDEKQKRISRDILGAILD